MPIQAETLVLTLTLGVGMPLQIAISVFLLMAMKISLEVSFGSENQPVNCEYVTFFTELTLLVLNMEFALVSVITMVLYMCIFRRIMKETAKREQIGKFE